MKHHKIFIQFLNLFFLISFSLILFSCDDLNPVSPFGKVTLATSLGNSDMDRIPSIVFDSEFECPAFSPYAMFYWRDIKIESWGHNKYDAAGRIKSTGRKIITNDGVVFSQFDNISYDSFHRAKKITEFREYVPGQKHQIEITDIVWRSKLGTWDELIGYTAFVDGFKYEYSNQQP